MRAVWSQTESRALGILQTSSRTCCNNSIFVGEMLFSHDSKFKSARTSTSWKRVFRLGDIHGFATSEQLLSDGLSPGGRWPMISSNSSWGRRIAALGSTETSTEMVKPGESDFNVVTLVLTCYYCR